MNSNSIASETFHFEENEFLLVSPIGKQTPTTQSIVQPAQQGQVTESAVGTFFDTESFPDDLLLSFLTPNSQPTTKTLLKPTLQQPIQHLWSQYFIFTEEQ